MKAISTKDFGTFHISECKDGFWLWDETREMNLSMRAKTSDDAFVEAIEYYQGRLKRIEAEYRSLKDKVDIFVNQFVDEEDL